ncbi:hypothetical protein CAPTEDRAFT_196193 [Capitella teleta]|uniref:Uncharacterized protein n=1 Tax=Capitella teleta TaxID=283909 RepID=R7TZX2_CAPTE|nr:hypothetical protein CAPTEDRAFT_196193 [Capitella teleta]|eukprot:ELT99498.1 hypothetical protein CAPTEDRAFT_196193 [Capitella teleta]
MPQHNHRSGSCSGQRQVLCASLATDSQNEDTSGAQLTTPLLSFVGRALLLHSADSSPVLASMPTLRHSDHTKHSTPTPRISAARDAQRPGLSSRRREHRHQAADTCVLPSVHGVLPNCVTINMAGRCVLLSMMAKTSNKKFIFNEGGTFKCEWWLACQRPKGHYARLLSYLFTVYYFLCLFTTINVLSVCLYVCLSETLR